MDRRTIDTEEKRSLLDILTVHNRRRVLLVGLIYSSLEIVGLILSTLGFFESDIRLPVTIIVSFHALYLPLLYLMGRGIILKTGHRRFAFTLVYSLVLIGWGSLLNALAYLQSSDISVYSMTVLVVASLFYLPPRFSIPLFSAGFVFFLSLVISWDTELSDSNAIIFKALIVTLLGLALSRGNYKMRKQLHESETKLLRANSSLKDLSLRDSMTGLFNNAYIYDFLQRAESLHKGREGALAVMMLDLDHFKSVNDTHGHSAGDEVLIRASNAMLSCIRDTDMAGRYGGEEFIVILTETNRDRAILVAERIRKAIEELRFDQGFSVSCSIGVAFKRAGGKEDLIEEADTLMYRAKKEGRNRVIY